MGHLLNILLAGLIIGWLVGYVGYNEGGLIHLLLVIAVIVVLVRIIQGRRVV